MEAMQRVFFSQTGIMSRPVPPHTSDIQATPVGPGNETLISSFQNASISTSLISPLRLLRYGHIFVAAYVCMLAVAIVWTCSEFDSVLNGHLLSLGRDLKISPGVHQSISFLSSIGIWALCLPVLLVAVTLPTEEFCLHQEVSFFRLLKLTPMNIFVAFQTLVLGIRSIFYFLIPLFSFVVGYIYAGQHGHLGQMPLVLHLSAFIVFLTVSWKVLPVLFAPIVAVCGQYTAIGALANSPLIVYKNLPNLLIIMLIGACFTIPAVYGLQQLELAADQKTLAYLVTGAAILWYTLSAATHELMIATGKVVFARQL